MLGELLEFGAGEGIAPIHCLFEGKAHSGALFDDVLFAAGEGGDVGILLEFGGDGFEVSSSFFDGNFWFALDGNTQFDCGIIN